MKRILFIFNILIGIVFTSFAQNVTLSGYIENKATGERLINATIVETKSGRGTSCNRYGFFSLSLPRGENRLSVSHVGFTRVESTINLQTDTLIVMSLMPGNYLEEVLVVEKKVGLKRWFQRPETLRFPQ